MGFFKGRKNDDLGLDDDRTGLDSEIPAYNDSAVDPFAQPASAQMHEQPMSQQPISGTPPNTPPPAGDFSNPDLNSVTGSPKPRDRENSPFMSAPQETPPASAGSSVHVEKDLQIIIAKLDAVKSELDSLHQRVQRIERIAEADQTAREKKQHQPYAPQW